MVIRRECLSSEETHTEEVRSKDAYNLFSSVSNNVNVCVCVHRKKEAANVENS